MYDEQTQMTAFGPCARCRTPFAFDPDRVPSIWVRDNGDPLDTRDLSASQLPDHGHLAPLCDGCDACVRQALAAGKAYFWPATNSLVMPHSA